MAITQKQIDKTAEFLAAKTGYTVGQMTTWLAAMITKLGGASDVAAIGWLKWMAHHHAMVDGDE